MKASTSFTTNNLDVFYDYRRIDRDSGGTDFWGSLWIRARAGLWRIRGIQDQSVRCCRDIVIHSAPKIPRAVSGETPLLLLLRAVFPEDQARDSTSRNR